MTKLQARIRIIPPSIAQAVADSSGEWTDRCNEAALGSAVATSLQSVLGRHPALAISPRVPYLAGSEYFTRLNGTTEIEVRVAIGGPSVRLSAEVRGQDRSSVVARGGLLAEIGVVAMALVRDLVLTTQPSSAENTELLSRLSPANGLVELANHFASVFGKPGRNPVYTAGAAGIAGSAHGYLRLAAWERWTRLLEGRAPDPRETLEILSHGLRLDSHDAEIVRAYAIAACDAGLPEEASRVLSKVSAQLPNNPLFELAAARLARSQSDHRRATVHVERAWELAPYSYECTGELALNHRSCGNLAGAIEVLRTAHATFPEDFYFEDALATELMHQGMFAESLRLFEALIRRAHHAHWDDLRMFKHAHLDFVDSVTWSCAQRMTECAVRSGHDPRGYAAAYFALSPDPRALQQAWGGAQRYLAHLKSKIPARADPLDSAAEYRRLTNAL